MGDIDILVHKGDLDKITNCLYDLGYEKDGEAGHHVGFTNDENHKIEVHWNLVNKSYFKGEVPLEDSLWKNVKKENINGVEVLAMSMEDMLVHLCLHMAVHIAYKGFGVRQLLDIALITKSIGNDINWERFKEESKENNVEKFSYLVFLTCSTLFNVDTPKELNGTFNVKKEEIDIFIDDILKSGIHGKRNSMASFSAQAAFDLDKDSVSNNVLKRYFGILFPQSYKLSEKYSYAKEFKILLPIAWLHRLLNGAFSEKFNLKDKISFFSSNILKSYKRNKLLRWLEL